MRRPCLVVLMLNTLTLGKDTPSDHRDYVPDKKTAERIAEAVLQAQFGEVQIKTRGPLLVDEADKDFWIVQASGGKKAMLTPGGGPAEWITRHSRCVKVMAYIK
ncbi:MAG TPA: NTF2 fold immunity protein [Candidatus Polarisedimenticolia bacterium]|nr:NTF2 fold immunity protein [Candidatus Polarisedimenticolia bacterium]